MDHLKKIDENRETKIKNSPMNPNNANYETYESICILK